MELNFAGIVCDLSMLTEIVSMPLEAQTAIAPTSDHVMILPKAYHIARDHLGCYS